jgi:solute carrier family 25 uncoupling protein 8/9
MRICHIVAVADVIMKATYADTPLAVKLLTAGTAGCVADFVSFPLDTAKVRLQVSSWSQLNSEHALTYA